MGDGEAAISPWSREAVESPLPSIEQIRERWRRELDLDTSIDDASVDPGTSVGPGTSVDPGLAPERRAISVPGQPRSAVTGDVVLGGVIVAGAIALALWIGWSIRPSPAPSAAGVLPASTEVRWSVALEPGLRPTAVAADAASVVAVADGRLSVRDATTGLERWRRGLPTEAGDVAVAVFADAVVAVGTGVRQDWAIGFDIDDGTVRWEHGGGERTTALLPDGVVEYVDNGGATAMRVIDPSTGTAIGPPTRATEMPTPPGLVVGGVGDDYVALDVATGVVYEPSVPAFGLASIAPVGDRLVGFTDDADIVLYGRTGTPLDQRPFVSNVFGDFPGRSRLVGGVPGSSIGIVASGTSIGFDVSNDRIEVLWEVRGRVGAPVDTADGPLAVARIVDPETGTVDVAVIDVRDGTTVAVTDDGTTRVADPLIVHDGYLRAPAVGDLDETIAAVGFDGVERWSMSTADASWYQLFDGVLYVLGRDGRLTAHG
jgi:hypothetical protein